jgi:hypothetical protein
MAINVVERIQYAQWLLERNLAWIAQAEVKVAVVISLDAAMISAAAAAYTAHSSKTAWAILASLLFGILVVSALGCAAMVVKPQVGGPLTSFIFFGRIAEKTEGDYSNSLLAASDAELLSDLVAQVHRNAQIASIKHKWVRLAILWSFLASTAWIVAISQLVK